MKRRFLGSLALASLLTSGVNAANVDVNAFGHIGTAYSFGTNKIQIEDQNDKPWFGGFTGRAGIEVGVGAVSFGLGFAGGLPYAASPSNFKSIVEDVYFTKAKDVKWYNWMSDAYLRIDTRMFSIVGGRYDSSKFFTGFDGKEHTGVDWFNGMNEGVSFKLSSQYVNWWGFYSYETMDFGAINPNRLGSDLMGFHQYRTVGHLLTTGLDFNIKDQFFVDPYFLYNIDLELWQAGGKVQADFGQGNFKSSSIFRGLYQDAGARDTFLAWFDQEFLIYNMVKLGAGAYIVGDDAGIYRHGDQSRFYGSNFGGGADYFGAGVASWYVFAGIINPYFKFDFLYAGGDYDEISAIASVGVYENRRSKLKFELGGGWVQSEGYDQGVVFTKLSF